MSTAGDAPQAAARPRRGPGKQKKTIKIPALLREQGRETALNRHWRAYFLAALVETSNITKAAAAAGVTPSRAYRVRQEDPEFRALWMGALAEGYHNLEMEVLGYLRDPQPGYKMDVANALRLLDRHRHLVAQQRALEGPAGNHYLFLFSVVRRRSFKPPDHRDWPNLGRREVAARGRG